MRCLAAVSNSVGLDCPHHIGACVRACGLLCFVLFEFVEFINYVYTYFFEDGGNTSRALVHCIDCVDCGRVTICMCR